MSPPKTDNRAQGVARETGCELEEAHGLLALIPQDQNQLAEVLSESKHRGFSLIPIGSGTQLAWCRPEALCDPAHAPVPISLRRMSRVLEHVPGEGTVTAQAGILWSELAASIEHLNECLPADLCGAASSTLGGILGAGRSGPDRMRRGPLRHHVLGMKVMLSDGTIASSGGRLVKNVTGFDLHRLYTGSRGSLAIILEASLRLMPKPESEWSFSLPVVSLEAGFGLALEVMQSMPRLHWAVVTRTNAEVRLEGGLHGRSSQVQADRSRVEEVLGGTRASFDTQSLADRDALRERGSESLHAWEIRCPLTKCSGVLGRLESELSAKTDLWVDCGCGRILIGPEEDRLAARAPGWIERIEEEAATVHPLCVPPQLHAEWAKAKPLDTHAEWQRRLTIGLDPEGTLSRDLEQGWAPH